VDRQEILYWLRLQDAQELQLLWNRADAVRREHVGDAVHLRGLVEISNFCSRGCHYCGLRAANQQVSRYRLSAKDILTCALQATELGYGTLVLQSGEDDLIEAQWLADIVRQIKAATPLAITLSLGERSASDLRAWKEAGADRYLLRFETSDRTLYRAIHPDRGAKISDRVAILRQLQALGYETGSGVMVGIPGQSYEILANDILLFRELDLDMIGIGPFIAHPDTPLGQRQPASLADHQVVPNLEMTCKVVALARILRPDANIPATTAVAVKDAWHGREMALRRGANVIMPNLTPGPFRALYSIYPGKADCIEIAEQSDRQIRAQITGLGRTVGEGQGSRRQHCTPKTGKTSTTLHIAVCMGSSCFSRGNNGRALEMLTHCAESAGFRPEIVGHLCENQCTQGPHITIEDTLYSNVQPACFPELLKHHLSSRKKERDG